MQQNSNRLEKSCDLKARIDRLSRVSASVHGRAAGPEILERKDTGQLEPYRQWARDSLPGDLRLYESIEALDM